MEGSGNGVDDLSAVKYSILQFNVGRERYDVGRFLFSSFTKNYSSSKVRESDHKKVLK
jgi:hypothetical protein